MNPALYLQWNYLFLFAFVGFYINLVSGHFQEAGFSGIQRAVFFSLVPAVTMAASVAWGHLADHIQNRTVLLKIFSGLSALALTGLLLWNNYLAYLVMAVVLGLLVFPMISLNDSLAVSQSRMTGGAFGHFRQWGTLGFILANIVVMIFHPLLAPLGVRAWHFLFGMPLALLALHGVSRGQSDTFTSQRRGKWGEMRRILRHPNLRLLFLATLLHNTAFVGNYSYFSAHLKNLGFAEGFIAFCWALSPAGEFFLFRSAHRIFMWLSPLRLFQVALFAGVLRWSVLSVVESAVAIAASQLLHTLAFGAYYLSAVEMLHQAVPEHLRSTGHGWFLAIGMSGALILGNLLMGVVLDAGDTRLVFRTATVIALLAFAVSLALRPVSPPEDPVTT